jgi:dienelactone hydrolase
VTVPDLFDGATFTSIEEGVEHVESVGFESIIDAGVARADDLPSDVVFGGFSLGALVAHKLAQTKPGALGALFYHHGDVPIDTFGETWPVAVDVQFHIAEGDEFYEPEVVAEFVDRVGEVARAEVYTYPGSAHLFADSSLGVFDPESTESVIQRSLDFLGRYA